MHACVCRLNFRNPPLFSDEHALLWAAERAKMTTLNFVNCNLTAIMYYQRSLQFNQLFIIQTNVSKCLTNKKS